MSSYDVLVACFADRHIVPDPGKEGVSSEANDDTKRQRSGSSSVHTQPPKLGVDAEISNCDSELSESGSVALFSSRLAVVRRGIHATTNTPTVDVAAAEPDLTEPHHEPSETTQYDVYDAQVTDGTSGSSIHHETAKHRDLRPLDKGVSLPPKEYSLGAFSRDAV